MSRRPGSGVAHLIERQMTMFYAQQRAAEEGVQPVTVAPERAVAHPYITVSRQYGAGGSRLAEAVAERLGWALYDKRLLEEIAQDARLQQRLLSPFDEHEHDDIEHWIRGLLTEETVSEHHYYKSLFRVLASIAKVGRCVIVGRGAHLALEPSKGLRVRVFAPLEARVANIMAEQGLSAPEARKRALRVEQTRQNWLVRAYGERAKEKVAFDLALNPTELPLDTCVELVIIALEGKCGPVR